MLKKEVLKQKKFIYAFYLCNQFAKMTLNLIGVLDFNVIFLISFFQINILTVLTVLIDFLLILT